MPKTDPGMSASGNSQWIDTTAFQLDTSLKELFERFVVHTPAYGLSAKGVDLFRDFSLTTPGDYKKVWDDFIFGIPSKNVLIGKTKSEVKDKIAGNSVLNFNSTPSPLAEAICIWVPKDLSDDELYRKHFNSLPKASSKGKRITEIKRESEEKWTIVYINKLFRHMRNGLAHGRFAKLTSDSQGYYVIEDEVNDEITARMILSSIRLRNWINSMVSIETRQNDAKRKEGEANG